MFLPWDDYRWRRSYDFTVIRTSGFLYSINYTNTISINICHHVSRPVLYTWDTIETNTNMALALMVPTVKNKKPDNHDCPVAIGFLLLLLLISQIPPKIVLEGDVRTH